MSDISKAKEIVSETAKHRARWGRHAGIPPQFSDEQVLDALVSLQESGLLEVEDNVDELRSQLATANRQRGAAEARAKKYKNQLDNANRNIKDLTLALEDCEDGLKSQAVRDSMGDEDGS